MDQHFTMRLAAHGLAHLLPLDFAQLTAALSVRQAASPTGRAATLLASPPRAALTPPQALAALFSGDAGWAGAAVTLNGRFHPAVRIGPAAYTLRQQA